MARAEKLTVAFKQCAGPFPWRDFEKLLTELGYEPVKSSGKTRGTKRKYFNRASGHIIDLHVPHGTEMERGMVKRLRRELEQKGVI